MAASKKTQLVLTNELVSNLQINFKERTYRSDVA